MYQRTYHNRHTQPTTIIYTRTCFEILKIHDQRLPVCVVHTPRRFRAIHKINNGKKKRSSFPYFSPHHPYTLTIIFRGKNLVRYTMFATLNTHEVSPVILRRNDEYVQIFRKCAFHAAKLPSFERDYKPHEISGG